MSGSQHPSSGQIAYHDYALMLALMDAEWSRSQLSSASSRSLDPFLRCQEDFLKHCRKYHDDIEENHKLWQKANERYESEDVVLADTGAPIESFLFDPVFYLPFGHADMMSFVLVDDFDPIHFLAAEAKKTVEEVCVAFCPKLESLGLKDHPSGLFCELDQLVGKDSMKASVAGPQPGGPSPKTHGFQDNLPLVAFTRYKIDGLAVLGQGLLFQQEIFKALGKRMADIADVLGQYVKNAGKDVANVEPNDVSSARCAFLDLQGLEEIGTLIFCRNYTVAMAFVVAARSLTYGDVLGIDPDKRLEDALRASPLHRTVMDVYFDLLGKERPDRIDALRDNHVFRWSQSTYGFTVKAMLDQGHKQCHGEVEAFSQIQIAPGHRSRVNHHIGGCSPNETHRATKQPGPNGLRLFQVGTGDLIYCPSLPERRQGSSLLPLGDVLDAIKSNLAAFTVKDTQETGRDVVDVDTVISVPLPEIPEHYWPEGTKPFCPDLRNHTAPLLRILPEARDRLCFSSGDTTDSSFCGSFRSDRRCTSSPPRLGWNNFAPGFCPSDLLQLRLHLSCQLLSDCYHIGN